MLQELQDQEESYERGKKRSLDATTPPRSAHNRRPRAASARRALRSRQETHDIHPKPDKRLPHVLNFPHEIRPNGCNISRQRSPRRRSPRSRAPRRWSRRSRSPARCQEAASTRHRSERDHLPKEGKHVSRDTASSHGARSQVGHRTARAHHQEERRKTHVVYLGEPREPVTLECDNCCSHSRDHAQKAVHAAQAPR